jgi:hypothetical protein
MAFQIKAADFTKDGGNKKFNWFFYEMACELATELTNPRMLKFFRKEGIVDQRIRHACQQMSLAMKEPILAKLSGKAEAVHINYTIVEAAFPKLSDRQVDKILDAVTRAYDTLTKGCVMCPTRCISEKDEECVLFLDTDVNQSEFGEAKEVSRV